MITFVTPPPGLASRHFDLLREEGADGVYTLASRDEPGLSLLVVDPSRWAPDYSPAIPVSALDALGELDEDPLVLVTASVSDREVRLNLMAPMLVNTSGESAVQVIVEGQRMRSLKLTA